MPEFLESEQHRVVVDNEYTVLSKCSKTFATNGNKGNQIQGVNVVHGNVASLSPNLLAWIEENVKMCKPSQIHICDGSKAENEKLLSLMRNRGTIIPLPKYDNCWLARTDPRDVARVESKTFICTRNPRDVLTDIQPKTKGILGNWMSLAEMNISVQERFPRCMEGRTMYVIPFSMGPIGSPFSKIGVELTDSPYVVASMRIMTRMGTPVLNLIQNNVEFVKALHSVGTPENGVVNVPSWPCDPERTLILHRPDNNEIISYGSGYGGNSLLGKKCFALRLGSVLAKREGWLAEHMLILGITNPQNEKRYFAAAFPSACGKTNLAMMQPTLPGYKIECVGDDIAWMRMNPRTHKLHAINPENGFFGVAPGTSHSTNPNAMKTIFANTIFTNVASTSDGGVWWEGMEEPAEGVEITDWLGNPWTRKSNSTAAHPNSRFCTPASQCPIIDPKWEDPEGVPIDAILFGGRRPKGVPLIYESHDWQHGVFIGATMRSEATAAAEHKDKVVMHDPFAMRPFFGYNFGHYLQHWLDIENNATEEDTLPLIFHVNWFLKNERNHFLWPGFGENIRVLEWIFKRVKKLPDTTENGAIGFIPKKSSFNLDGIEDDIMWDDLFRTPQGLWKQEIGYLRKFFHEQVGSDVPEGILMELNALRLRVRDIID